MSRRPRERPFFHALREERQFLRGGLGNQGAIERVAMQGRQMVDARDMFGPQRHGRGGQLFQGIQPPGAGIADL